MPIQTGDLLGRVALRFDRRAAYAPEDLSAAARAPDGTYLFAADERAAIERLRLGPGRSHELAGHECFSLTKPLGLAADAEADIEGFAVDDSGSALYLVGSHSARRKRTRGKQQRADLARLATVVVDPARFVLARVPLGDDGPRVSDRRATVARLPDAGPGSLLDLLARDEHLATFLPTARSGGRVPIPGKDNGFDIEGLGFYDGRLLVGLRGPVLRGWAFVLDLELEARGTTLEARARKGRARYRKHALELDGLGVREIIVRGDDVLVLAGPTMALDGAHRVFRWHGGPSARGDSVVRKSRRGLEPLFDLPYGPGVDHAEGIARFDWFDEDDALLVVYDSPGHGRRLGDACVLADVFAVA